MCIVQGFGMEGEKLDGLWIGSDQEINSLESYRTQEKSGHIILLFI